MLFVKALQASSVRNYRASTELAAYTEDLDLILRERRLRWFGHVEHSSGAVRSACDIHINCRRGQGGPS